MQHGPCTRMVRKFVNKWIFGHKRFLFSYSRFCVLFLRRGDTWIIGLAKFSFLRDILAQGPCCSSILESPNLKSIDDFFTEKKSTHSSYLSRMVLFYQSLQQWIFWRFSVTVIILYSFSCNMIEKWVKEYNDTKSIFV